VVPEPQSSNGSLKKCRFGFKSNVASAINGAGSGSVTNARRSAMRSNGNVFYVYALVDARDQSVFYIGKGKGQRAEQHERMVRSKKHPNVQVSARIAAILSAGATVTILRLWTDLSEADAFQRELRLITMIGVERLANVSPGFLGWEDNQRLRAAHLLTQYPEAPEDVRAEIQTMADGRKITPRTVQSGDLDRVTRLWTGQPRLDCLISAHG
jgi:hypothetical protein